MNHTSRITLHESRITQHALRNTHYASRITHHALHILCLAVLLLAFPFPAAAQDDTTFTATVDRTAVTTDDLLTLRLTLAGAFNASGQPQIPPLEGFAIVSTSQSSQFKMVNGVFSSQVVFTYQLRPTRTGTLTIPAIAIQAAGQTYQTQPITIEVTQGATPPAQQPDQSAPAEATTPNELAGQDVYVEAEVDNATPVVGQQIIYRFRLYQGIQLFNQPRLDLPEFSGFLSYELSPNNQYYQQATGRQYLVTEVRRALFPAVPGETTIAPATLTIPGGAFNRTVEFPTNAVAVTVQPLPEGQPEGFGGAVGQFEIEAWVDPTEGRVNEPVTLFVRVSGVGNANLLPDPTEGVEAALPGWRVYDPQVATDIGQDGDVIRGERLFERPLVPKTEGELTIPSFGLSFFDPAAGTYRLIETDPLVIHVAPGEAPIAGPVIIGEGKQGVIVLATDIRHIKPAPPALAAGRTSLLTQPLYWLGWVGPLLMVASVWIWDRRRLHLAQDVALARAQRARRLARKRLSQARKLLKTDEGAAYAAVATTLNAYLGDKFNLPAAGLTRDTIRRTLTSRSVPGELTDRLLVCLDWADSGRFAPAAAGREAGELVTEAERIISELEENMR